MLDSIQNIDYSKFALEEKKQAIAPTTDQLFVNSFDAAKELLQVTNEAEQVGKQLTEDFMTGKNENIHSLMIAQEKASILLQFTMQVRNQVLEAYKEIMRMPV